ncbi:MAG TPA: inositol monophosphatase [Gammaproteobacteria bacterium]|nr:inositol monophosphatase [Gammaproteobacteria bacterium]
MRPLLNTAVTAARKAGALIARAVDRLDTLKVDTKAPNDFVSEIDIKAERIIVETLQRAYPGHAILAEESGSRGRDEYQWIIDPLDGTTNFLHGFPQFAVSIALKYRGNIEVGVIYDPLRQELFTALRGSSAQRDGRRIRVTKARTLEGTLLGTGFPFRDQSHLDAYLAMFKTFLPQTAGIRRAGSAALDLAYVAAGRLDGFWEIGLKPWDMAAGVLLVQEAGGYVGDLRGGERYLDSGHLVAGSPKVYEAMLKAIAPHLTTELH